MARQRLPEAENEPGAKSEQRGAPWCTLGLGPWFGGVCGRAWPTCRYEEVRERRGYRRLCCGYDGAVEVETARSVVTATTTATAAFDNCYCSYSYIRDGLVLYLLFLQKTKTHRFS
jgi:hypothetical protein